MSTAPLALSRRLWATRPPTTLACLATTLRVKASPLACYAQPVSGAKAVYVKAVERAPTASSKAQAFVPSVQPAPTVPMWAAARHVRCTAKRAFHFSAERAPARVATASVAWWPTTAAFRAAWECTAKINFASIAPWGSSICKSLMPQTAALASAVCAPQTTRRWTTPAAFRRHPVLWPTRRAPEQSLARPANIAAPTTPPANRAPPATLPRMRRASLALPVGWVST